MKDHPTVERAMFVRPNGILAPLLILAATVPSAAHGQDLTLLREIGVVDGPPEYAFVRVTHLVVDSARNIYVLDTGDRAVKVFDASGRFRARMGREGSGPGEFLVPSMLRVTHDAVMVLDAPQSRISRFDLQGRHLETTPLDVPPGFDVGGLHTLRGGHTLLRTLYRAALGTDHHDPYVHVVLVREDDSAPDTLASYEPPAVLWYTRDARAPWGGVTTHFGDGGAVAVSGDSLIAFVDGEAGTVRLLAVRAAGPSPIGTYDLGARGRPFPEEALLAIRDSIRAARRSSAIDVSGPAVRSAISGNAFFDDRDALWIELEPAATGREWVRLDVRTGATRRLRVPRQFVIHAVRDARLYGVWMNELDVQTIRVYALPQE